MHASFKSEISAQAVRVAVQAPAASLKPSPEGSVTVRERATGSVDGERAPGVSTASIRPLVIAYVICGAVRVAVIVTRVPALFTVIRGV